MSHFRLENSAHLAIESSYSLEEAAGRANRAAAKRERRKSRRREKGVDSVARILDVIAEAPLRLYTGKQQVRFPSGGRRGAATAPSTQPGQLFPRGTVLMEATVLARLSSFPHPKIILQNYSNTADVSETLRFTPICKDDSKNASFWE